ncbi:conserved hypothetical protein [Candidatus Terasakiella magnetica]|nr:conserved hypothetical protein [Candidatus Terasakiella magnetica]
MRRLIGFLLATALVIAGVVWLADRPGEVTIHWQGWRVDTSVPVLLAGLLLVLVLFSGLGRMARLVLGAPARFLRYRRTTRQAKGYRALSDGLAAIAMGDGRGAAKLARRADSLLKDPSLTGLLSVQAATLTGNDAVLQLQAMTERPETAFLGHKGLLDLAVKADDRAGALDHGRRAFALNPGAEGLAVTVFDLQMTAGLWAEAEHTLTAARRHGGLRGADLDRRRALVLFARAEAALKADDAALALSLAEDARDADPRFIPAVSLVAELLRRKGKARKAASLILSAFKVTPHPDLIAVWRALGEAETPLDWVKRMQKLTEANPASCEGHLALAEAALEAHLWGQARTHLDKVMAERPSWQTCALLARLERDEKKDENAALIWMAKAPALASDSAWTCGACGSVAPGYSVSCPACGSVGGLEWK